MQNDNLMCLKVYSDKDLVRMPHNHPHKQINYIMKGKFEIEIDGIRKAFGVGYSMYIQPDMVLLKS